MTTWSRALGIVIKGNVNDDNHDNNDDNDDCDDYDDNDSNDSINMFSKEAS